MARVKGSAMEMGLAMVEMGLVQPLVLMSVLVWVLEHTCWVLGLAQLYPGS